MHFFFPHKKLGENHEKTQESSECLKHLTQQAVVLQKKMNDIYSNGKLLTSGLPPIHIQPPSMGSVLDMLNAINGIIFVQIRWELLHYFCILCITNEISPLINSPKDIANIKNEIEKRQKEGGDEIENGDENNTAAIESGLIKSEAIVKTQAPATATIQSWNWLMLRRFQQNKNSHYYIY